MPIAVSAYEHLAGEMLKLYEEAEQRMLERVSSRLARGVSGQGWTEQKYSEMAAVKKEIQTAIAEMRRQRRELAKDCVSGAYAESAQEFVNEARMFTDVIGVTHLSPNAQKAAAILSELNSSLDVADRVILRKANDAYADIVGRVSSAVATGTMTVREAVKLEVASFANKGITSFVDKAGRAWEMSNYAEMATLTAIEKATLEGYTDTMQEYGFDLAVISSHYGACPLCAAWEGVIISVSGKDSKYPSLGEAESAGVFHPRCLHHVSTYYEGITKNTRDKPRQVKPMSVPYSTRQKQRSFEHKIRVWKRRMASATTPEDERVAYAHVRKYQEAIRNLIGDYNAKTPMSVDWLPRKYWREGGSTKMSAAARKLPPIAIK